MITPITQLNADHVTAALETAGATFKAACDRLDEDKSARARKIIYEGGIGDEQGVVHQFQESKNRRQLVDEVIIASRHLFLGRDRDTLDLVEVYLNSFINSMNSRDPAFRHMIHIREAHKAGLNNFRRQVDELRAITQRNPRPLDRLEQRMQEIDNAEIIANNIINDKDGIGVRLAECQSPEATFAVLGNYKRDLKKYKTPVRAIVGNYIQNVAQTLAAQDPEGCSRFAREHQATMER